jgi:MraZ protein
MSNHYGEYEITVDSKGRFMLPASYLRQVNDDKVSFMISRGFENCLTLYTMLQWQKVEAVINQINDFNEDARRFKRIFLNGATPIDKDSAGRILLSKPMLEYAGITKDAVFSAQSDKVEIWDKSTFKKEFDMSSNDFSALASKVVGSNFLNPLQG